MTVHSLSEALEDSAALCDVAQKAGVTLAQAMLMAAALAELPAKQVVRICSTAQTDRIRRANRSARR